jgi:L-2-hydroxyglutarate oxidase LhgO
VQLCLEGKVLLYEYLKDRNINFENCGKIVFATKSSELEKFNTIIDNAQRCDVAYKMMSNVDLKKFKETISPCEAVFIKDTGIFDSHNFLLSLELDAIENGATIALETKLISMHINSKCLTLLCDCNGDRFLIDAGIVINALGGNALDLLKKNFAERYQQYENYFIKGHYFSYFKRLNISPLIYPIPSQLGLGVHLTKDLAGGIRFGPDTMWVEESDDYKQQIDRRHFYEQIKSKYHNININDLSFSYAGIRPKLKKNKKLQTDFYIKSDFDGRIISLLGIESPGLTASLSIGRLVCKQVL